MAYEYRLVRLRVNSETAEMLAALGARNWQLAAMADGFAIFQRYVRSESDPDLPRDDPGRCEIEKADGG